MAPDCWGPKYQSLVGITSAPIGRATSDYRIVGTDEIGLFSF
jgi:hypothetical protein